MRAVDAHHEHRRQRGELNSDPHQADVVGQQAEIHGEHQGLVHGVVEAQIARREPPDLQLMADVAGAERAGREGDESGEHDKHHVEIVDEQEGARRGPLDEQRERGHEGGERNQHIEARAQPVAGQQRQQDSAERRDHQDCAQGIERSMEHGRAHSRSPRKASSAPTSTESKRSRMRNRNTPMTMKAIRTEKATLISTTSGMPLAPVAARIMPFSSDMNPTTWLTALRRVTIISSPSRTTESANARSSRASGSAWAVAFNMTTIERATNPMPASMVGPVPTTVSIVR